jgi:signal transduction histidine kinase
MTAYVRYGAAATAGAIVLFAGSLLVQGDLDRTLQHETLWAGGDAGALWIVALFLCAAAFAASSVRDALLLSVVAVSWVAPALGAWTAGPAAAAAAPALSALAIPALWQLLLDATAPASRARRAAVGVVWLAIGACAAALLVLRDPFLDIRCAGGCASNPLLITAAPAGVAAAYVTVDVVAIIVAICALGWSIGRLPTRRDVRGLAPTPALVVAGVAAASWWLPLSDESWRTGVLEPAMAAALLVLAVVRIGERVMAEVRRAALRRLADDLAAGSQGDLGSRLASALGVEHLSVLYPLDRDRWVVASGQTCEPPTDAGITEIRRGEETVAVVVGVDPARTDLGAVGPAASIAIDNERLRAGVSAHLSALRRSRLGVVEAADEERRAIERNLHDGMQQSLLILQYELGLAATREQDASRRAQLEALRQEAHRVVERLREIAHGVFPTALDDLGIEAALQRLVDDAPFPLEISVSPGSRAPRPVERTGYLLAREVFSTGPPDEGALTIDIGRDDEVLSVRAGNAPTEVSQTLRDRIDALGGRILRRDDGVEVILPCASS